MGKITVGINEETQRAMKESGVMPDKPTVTKPTADIPTVASKLSKKNATQTNFTNADVDNMTGTQLLKYMALPEGKAKGGYVKKYAKGGGVRRARTYG